MRARPRPDRRLDNARPPKPPAAKSSATTVRWRAHRPPSLRRVRRHAPTSTEALTPRRRQQRVDRAGRPDAGVAMHAGLHPRMAPDSPLTDVTSVKIAVLRRGRRGRAAANASSAVTRWRAPRTRVGRPDRRRLFIGAPWVVSVDDHVDPHCWADGRRAGAGLRRARGARPVRRARRCRRGDLASAASGRRGAGGHRGRGPPGVRARRGLVPRRHPGGRHRPANWCGRCAKATPDSCCPLLDRAIELLTRARESWPRRTRWPNSSMPAMPPARVTTASRATRSSPIVIGAENWRRAAGRRGPRRRGDQIRSANPG